MFNISKNNKLKIPMPQALALLLISVFVSSLSALAGTTSSYANTPFGNNSCGTSITNSLPNSCATPQNSECAPPCYPNNYSGNGANSVPNTNSCAAPFIPGNRFCTPYITPNCGTQPLPGCVQNYNSGICPSNVINPPRAIVVAGAGSSPGLSLGNNIYGAPGTTTLFNPLVPGASFSLPGVPSALGAPPPLGSGSVPLPPNPGMSSTPPTLIPWATGIAGIPISLPTNQVVAPANQINLQSNRISLPLINAIALPPGVMNVIVRGSIPYAPSTPGANPGMLRPPSFYNGSSQAVPGQSQNSAAGLGTVNSNGQINGTAPITRPVRQGSNDFGLSSSNYPNGPNQFKPNAYRAQFTNNNGQSTVPEWVPQQGSITTDFGLGDKALAYQQDVANQEAAKNNTTPPKIIGQEAQISYNSPRPAQYPGQGEEGVPDQNSPGNHSPSPGMRFLDAQVTNDLYGIPMINPNKMYTNADGIVSKGTPQELQPLTTIIPPPTPHTN